MVKMLKRIINEMKLRLPAKSVNESVCRAIISALGIFKGVALACNRVDQCLNFSFVAYSLGRVH